MPGIAPLHQKVCGIYAHLFVDDQSDAMAAVGAMVALKAKSDNVIPLHG
jgi:hypothetical protein